MEELIEYRSKLLARLKAAAREFAEACKTRGAHEKAEGMWTVHQIASHTRDVAALVYGMRIERTLKEDNPLFQNFDADAWMESHYNKDEPLENILNELTTHINALCETLSSLPGGAWARVSRHESLGGELTLQLWVERNLAHIEEHLKSVSSG